MAEELDSNSLKPNEEIEKKKKLKKYTFQFIITSINVIFLYFLIKYVIYPSIYTVFY